jgi:hypothetical protein
VPVPVLCRHAALVDHPSAKKISAMTNIHRSGVINRVRPINACRPTGPPMVADNA